MNKTYKVYLHICPNNMVYVGVTSQDLKLRWRPSQYKKTALRHYIELYGWENIKHKVVFEFDNKEEALKKEDELIQNYRELEICINEQRSGWISKDVNAYTRQLKKDNPEYRERCNAYARQLKKNNPEYKEKQNELTRKWIKEHKDDPEFKRKRNEKSSEYQRNHREERNAYKRQWRAKKKAEKLLQSGQIEIPIAV